MWFLDRLGRGNLAVCYPLKIDVQVGDVITSCGVANRHKGNVTGGCCRCRVAKGMEAILIWHAPSKTQSSLWLFAQSLALE